ncbi:hypothetical protein [Ktedonospora formicarum]|uniref:Uncharacterized protein n=1 Tax=Ktedonospora formicarum TaxID=2778364 RepID=A0A8J3ICJ1_9CHLR|nr:hypothetical protein [Ktedonospora formicarum]GHO50730.1 hypothetical protein KSX_88930 [Ktedonospora formicarum]
MFFSGIPPPADANRSLLCASFHQQTFQHPYSPDETRLAPFSRIVNLQLSDIMIRF